MLYAIASSEYEMITNYKNNLSINLSCKIDVGTILRNQYKLVAYTLSSNSSLGGISRILGTVPICILYIINMVFCNIKCFTYITVYLHVLLLFLFYYRSFYLSLNKKDCLGDDDQTLKTLGLVSGDLIHLVSTNPDNVQGNSTTMIRYTRGQVHA